ncbi:hypothetical protein HYALB_00013201 [Hymenoscyphus albidus]|uniref:Uncharacterized protein n=1 Tax=Hymenoscyphus albidus TaxID=595503 RepID=A0A9N9Q8V0_9HELO|nr:hypothetical protein HYALB_00013201 [Hymenoscyphus albidus]
MPRAPPPVSSRSPPIPSVKSHIGGREVTPLNYPIGIKKKKKKKTKLAKSKQRWNRREREKLRKAASRHEKDHEDKQIRPGSQVINNSTPTQSKGEESTEEESDEDDEDDDNEDEKENAKPSLGLTPSSYGGR